MNSQTEDYLDQVYAPLVGVVPYARRQELRNELREHLEALIATHQELGSSREVAVLMALRQFGPPRDLARMWAREWKQDAPPARSGPAWRAMGIGLGCFGLASLFALRMLVAACPDGYGWNYDPTAVMLPAVGGLLPSLAGLAAGLAAPARHALGCFFAVAALIVPTAILASGVAHTIPGTAGAGVSTAALNLALLQPFLWLPIGCGAAALGGSLRARLAQRPGRWVLQ